MTDKEKGSYEYRLKLERDRERKWRKSRQGATEFAFSSFDEMMRQFEDPSKIALFSDNGRGAEAINRIDSDEEIIAEALSRLDEPNRDFAKAVLDGMTWETSGLTRQGFNKKIRTLVKILVSTSPQKGRYQT